MPLTRITLLDYRNEREALVGDFEWVQFSYGDLRVAPHGDHIKGLEQGKPNDRRAYEWRWKGKWYSDLVLSQTPEWGDVAKEPSEVKRVVAKQRLTTLQKLRDDMAESFRESEGLPPKAYEDMANLEKDIAKARAEVERFPRR